MEKTIPISYENSFSYNVVIRHDFHKLIENIKGIKDRKYDKVCIFTDDIVSGLYLDELVGALKAEYNTVITFVMEHGESNKQLSVVEKLYETLIQNRFDRGDLLIALGGGVVGDMCGFAAATYLRGIDYIQIPTTLLSQVDSSVGGKTAVDYNSYKNMVGTFYMPRLVYINLDTLKSLPKEQLSCGMGEVIKYGLIMDQSFYQWLGTKNIDSLSDDDIFRIVETSVLCKKRVVEEDPKEKGIRSYLNFGHTIGHAIEKLSDFKLFHGQCVAIGMVAAMRLSLQHGDISDVDIDGCIDILSAYELPDHIPAQYYTYTVDDIIRAMKNDKKASAGRLKFIILKEIGKADSYMDFSDEDFRGAIETVIA